MLRRLGDWFYDRLGLETPLGFLRGHKVPPAHATARGWLYVFGSATLTAFLLQALSGIALTTKYVPSPAHAHDSLIYITEQASLGAFTRGLHFWGASAMVVLVLLHLARVYLFGAYKAPREFNWISGSLLLFLTGAMALSGQLLRWNQDGVWTVLVASRFAERVPLIGRAFSEFILGGETVGGVTLTRFYSLHAMVLPGLIALTVGVHLYLLAFHGVTEPPSAAQPTDTRAYRAWYQKLKAEHGERYFPDTIWKEAVTSVVVLATVAALALLLGPRPTGLPPDPTTLSANPRPDWFVIWYYALLWLKPRGLETALMVYLPLGVAALLLLLPLVAGRGQRSPARRPWAVAIVVGAVTALVFLVWLGERAPWVPDFDSPPLTAAQLGPVGPTAVEGAQAFHRRGCQYCHRVLGRGGHYGPELTGVLRRISPEEVAVRTLKGYGDMPSFREVLERQELDEILALLEATKDR